MDKEAVYVLSLVRAEPVLDQMFEVDEKRVWSMDLLSEPKMAIWGQDCRDLDRSRSLLSLNQIYSKILGAEVLNYLGREVDLSGF